MKKKGFDTKLSFLDYWKIKNKNDNGTFLCTIRDAEGKKIYRNFKRIDKTISTISLTKILEQLKLENDFLGSIECEFHSTDDLKLLMAEELTSTKPTISVPSTLATLRPCPFEFPPHPIKAIRVVFDMIFSAK